MESCSTSQDYVSRGLPSAVLVHILTLLPANERALTGRLVCHDAWEALSGPEHCTAALAQPLPPHATPVAQEAGQQRLRELSFYDKPQLLCKAVASGCGVNLEAAWAALQPSFFPELLSRREWMTSDQFPCPGVAAVRADHPQLLHWLVCNCPALLKPHDCVIEAGRHCDLAGLQVVCQAVSSMLWDSLWRWKVLAAAAESATGDAVAKLEWLLATYSDQQLRVTHRTVQAAVRSGDLGRLRWLHGRGWLLSAEGVPWEYAHSGLTPGHGLVVAALRHADLATVQWLVDEVGCRLPAPALVPGWEGQQLECLEAAIMGPDSVAKVVWLRQQGVGITLTRELLNGCVRAVVQADNEDMLLYLQSLCGPAGSQGHALLQQAMAGTRACPVSAAMAQQMVAAGYELGPELCYRAAEGGHVALLRWLVHEAGVSAAGGESVVTLECLIKNWRSEPRVLLEVVQLLLEGGYQAWDAAHAVRAAASRGDLALMNGLLCLKPWGKQDLDVLAAACCGGCEALLEQLLEQQEWYEGSGCLSCCFYVHAAARGDRATLTALRRLGVPWGAGNVVVQAVREDARPPALRWLVDQGAPVGNQRDMRQAVDYWDLGTVMRSKVPLPRNTADWLVNLSVPDWQPTARPASATTYSPTRTSGVVACMTSGNALGITPATTQL